MYKQVVLVGLIIVVLLVAGGCQAEADPAVVTPTPETVFVGLSLSTLSDSHFLAIQEGALEAAERLDVTLVIQNAENDALRQFEQIQTLIGQEVDALIISPVDSALVVDGIFAANQAGVPVFTVDRTATQGEVISHIASDNVEGGRMAIRFLADRLRERGTLIELQGTPGVSIAQDRSRGFRQEVQQYPELQVVARGMGDFDRDAAKMVFASLLETHKQISGVFAHNDEMILGAIAAAEEAGRSEEIVFIGFDALEEAVIEIDRGRLQATIAQQPQEMGRRAIELTVEYLRTGEVDAAFVPVDLALVSR